MAWLHLHRDILSEFAGWARYGFALGFFYRVRDHKAVALDAWQRERKGLLKSKRLLRARMTLAAARPPCPHCGGKVERLGTTGTPPIYCSPQHMQAAKWKRWAEKNRRAA